MDKQKIMPIATLASVGAFGLLLLHLSNGSMNFGLFLAAGMTVIGFAWAKMQEEVDND